MTTDRTHGITSFRPLSMYGNVRESTSNLISTHCSSLHFPALALLASKRRWTFRGLGVESRGSGHYRLLYIGQYPNILPALYMVMIGSRTIWHYPMPVVEAQSEVVVNFSVTADLDNTSLS